LLLFWGAAAIFYIQGAGVLHKAYASAKWPAAEGVVVSSAVSFHPGSNRSGAYYSPDVVYRYRVGRMYYIGDTIAFASFATSNRSDMAKIAQRYPAGRKVAVRYDASRPEESVLEPGMTFNSWTKVLGASVFLLMGAGVMLFPRKKAGAGLQTRGRR
ncbi:MAG: DUF3592 domain-containing protein, partial [Nitrospiraceae bacterium]|nr:DUF3592 domain-containing protein [Nitrospiraceae bacterium]